MLLDCFQKNPPQPPFAKKEDIGPQNTCFWNINP
jgi:hypothetical protein